MVLLYERKVTSSTWKLTLNPSKLSNPDADLRYTIPEKIEKLSDNQLHDNGYDYDDEDNMIIFMSSSSMDTEQAFLIASKACQELGLEQEAIAIDENV
ncbi:hypothetical protein [Motilimonas cestriensis]|uniref:hypothetical protein n=1 Tax=Motilimonas cestriensis TaxID=2742685 RepID=UPI003DA2C723